MKFKSLLKDEIEVRICKISRVIWFWIIKNRDDFGFYEITSENVESNQAAKSDFIACAKRNGWKKYKFV